jgi:hypothetical protein
MSNSKKTNLQPVPDPTNDEIFENLAEHRLPQDFDEQAGVEEVVSHVTVCRPPKEHFIRVHEGEDYFKQGPFGLLELKEDREVYFIPASLAAALIEEEPCVAPYWLFLAITRQGKLYLWPVRKPRSGERQNRWWESALVLAERATREWYRIIPSQAEGGYRGLKKIGVNEDPNWPDLSFNEILKLAFKDRIITSRDHEVLQRLRGR